MKKLFLILLFLAVSQAIFAQSRTEAYKLGEFERNGGGGCEEYFRFLYLLDEIDKHEGSRGLVVIYSGDNKEKFGNILAYVSGAKEYWSNWSNRMKVPSDKVSFIISEGKGFFNEEFWIVPKNAKLPDIKPLEFDWSNLKDKYHFSYTCLGCEPSYPYLTYFQPGLKDFAEVLRESIHFQGVVEIQLDSNDGSALKFAREYAAEYRKMLTKDYGINNKRITIKINKPIEEDDLVPITANLYIVPKAFKNKN